MQILECVVVVVQQSTVITNADDRKSSVTQTYFPGHPKDFLPVKRNVCLFQLCVMRNTLVCYWNYTVPSGELEYM